MQVARSFRDVFAQLVPGGRGELVMQKALPGAGGGAAAGEDGENEDPGASAAGRAEAPVEKYAGVKIKVREGAGRLWAVAGGDDNACG